MNQAPVGPYDPCPCGSGAKYKFCCRDKDREARRADAPADDIESDTVECKPWDQNPRAIDSQMRELREAVVGFANSQGGVVVLGVADRKRTRREAVQGVGDLDANNLRRKIYDGTEPHVLVDVEELIEPEGRLLLIHVPKGIPPHTTSEGVAKIRIGKETKPLTGSQLSQILFTGGQKDLSAQVLPDSSLSDLDLDEIKRQVLLPMPQALPQPALASLL